MTKYAAMSMDTLAAEFKSLMESGEKDQWKLAEMAWTAGESHGGIKELAAKSGYAANTISKYRKAFQFRANESDRSELVFADIITLVKFSAEKADAIQVLAGAMDTAISTTSKDTEAVSIVQSFLAENPDLITEAMKDDATRSVVVGAAFKAASDGVVAAATGITKEAAKAKGPKRNTTTRAAEVERVKYSAAMAGRWASGNLPGIVRDTEALAEYMTMDELTFIHDQLANAFDLISDARKAIDAIRKAKV